MAYDTKAIDWREYASDLEHQLEDVRKQLIAQTARLETAAIALVRLKKLMEFRDQHPLEVFAELEPYEVQKIHKALSRCGVRAPIDRMRASWSRHVANHVLNGKAKRTATSR